MYRWSQITTRKPVCDTLLDATDASSSANTAHVHALSLARRKQEFRGVMLGTRAKREDKIKHFLDDDLTKIKKTLAKNLQNVEIGAVQRFLNLVDLEKCFKMRIWT